MPGLYWTFNKPDNCNILLNGLTGTQKLLLYLVLIPILSSSPMFRLLNCLDFTELIGFGSDPYSIIFSRTFYKKIDVRNWKKLKIGILKK